MSLQRFDTSTRMSQIVIHNDTIYLAGQVGDPSGNITEQTQTITVSDNTAPTFTAPADIEIFTDASCNYDATVTQTGDVTDEADNCSTDLEATYVDAIADGDCANESIITRTWSLTDECDNTTTLVQTITIQDDVDPVLVGVPSDVTVECDGAGNQVALNEWLANNGGATATDGCTTGLTWTNNFTSLSDDCGETGTATVIVTVFPGSAFLYTTSTVD